MLEARRTLDHPAFHYMDP
jgi:hypothetical protein